MIFRHFDEHISYGREAFYIMLRSPVIMWPVGLYMNGNLHEYNQED